MEQRRTSVSSGSPFEPQVGFCRAVRVGSVIAVAGTAPLSAGGGTVGIGDAAAQARRCLEIIAGALERLGANISDVVRLVFSSRISTIGMPWDKSTASFSKMSGGCYGCAGRKINRSGLIGVD
jgi:enamine deaminase RidA (YjgF/YER057c/UK114 family)